MEARRDKKAFHVIAKTFIGQLIGLIGENLTLSTFANELELQAKNKELDHVAPTKFFQTMNTVTEFDSEAEPGEKACIGEMVLRCDERLFSGKVSVPVLDSLQLVQIWPKLSGENKVLVWDYLKRLAKHSAQFVVAVTAAKI